MREHINPCYCLLIFIILYYCTCLNAKRTVLVISMIEAIAIIVIIVYDILGTTVVPDLRGFYMSFIISCSRVSIFHPCQLIDAILMCMEPSILIRFGSCCISALACKLLSLLSLLSLLEVTAFLKNCIYICIFVLHEGMVFLV